MGTAEIHLHLEGSLEPATVAEIDPSVRAEEVTAAYQYSTFAGFLEAYKWVVARLNTPGDYAIAARRLFERLTQEGVTHLDLNLSIGVMLRRELPARAIIEAIRAEAAVTTIEVDYVFDAVRQWGPEAALPVAELAREYGAMFGVGGDETRWPLADYRDAARRAGGWFVPHAGETSDARNVWEAVECGARRIGHGIRAIKDETLCRRLRDDDIPLEISISSNVMTGSVPSLAGHPVRRLFDLGVPITLNTDDPAMFHTTLAREFEIARQVFGFTEREIGQLRQNALKYRRAC